MRAQLLLLLVFFGAGTMHADTVHFNQIEVKKVSPTQLTLEYRISNYELWRGLIAPGKTEQEFFAQISSQPQDTFDKHFAKAVGQLVKQTRIELPSTRKAKVQQTDLPNGSDARDLLRQSYLLKELTTNIQPHLVPLVVVVHMRSPEQLQRVRISAPSLLHPVLIVHGSDRFWLTSQVEKSLLDLYSP